MLKPTRALAPLLCQRDQFSIPLGHCFLNSAYMGPLPKLVEQAGVPELVSRGIEGFCRAIGESRWWWDFVCRGRGAQVSGCEWHGDRDRASLKCSLHQRTEW